MESQKGQNSKLPPQKIFHEDSYLTPYIPIFQEIYKREKQLLKKINKAYKNGLDTFSRGYNYYGIFEDETHYIVREWLPEAKAVFLMGDFNFWNREEHRLTKNEFGVFILHLPKSSVTIKEHSCIKLFIHASNGEYYDRNMAYARYCTQDEQSLAFCQRYVKVFRPKDKKKKAGLKKGYSRSGSMGQSPFKSKEKLVNDRKNEKPEQLLIYESHVGMSSEFGHVASYKYFMEHRLPYIKGQGYTAVQIMAVQEHAYYGSFGYQVTNFFAPSSRFGTPQEFRALVDRAHELGLKVVIDLVLSHASSNAFDGIGLMDGSGYQYFHGGDAGTHDVWGSKLFNYSKFEVLRFLGSNIRYWIDEFDVDGFRLDAVTSMLYKHHGVGVGFTGNYTEYFTNDVLDLVNNNFQITLNFFPKFFSQNPDNFLL